MSVKIKVDIKKPKVYRGNYEIISDSYGEEHTVMFDIRMEDFIVWVDDDNYLFWYIYDSKSLKQNLLKSDLDSTLIDGIVDFAINWYNL